MPDFEAVEFGRVGEGCFGVLPDVTAQLALKDRVQKRAHFYFLASGEKLHPSVVQIPD